jgi:hypothetical protein
MCRSTNSIKVVLRFRPQNRREIESGGQPIVQFESEDTCRLDVRINPSEVLWAGNYGNVTDSLIVS